MHLSLQCCVNAFSNGVANALINARINAERDLKKRGSLHMKTVAFGTLKGGTGKTAVTFNVGGILAENHRVLFIDIDPQANLTNNVGLDTTVQDAPSVRDIFDKTGDDSPERLITVSPIPELPNLDIIASHIRLTATELRLVSVPAREFIIQKWLKKHGSLYLSRLP